ncbi:MAG: T9SS type A sorting domain-containing protein, partial [Bacteroidetes bacterium]|nr:T9SS type A sorting domain-containing protein [Bacteroidota bacterium]
ISYSNGLQGNCLISGTSNSSTFTTTPDACGGTVTETWTATDNCGRALASVSRTITVLPSDLPTMTALPDIQVACGSIPTASTISYSNGLQGNCLISGTSNSSTFTTTPDACGGTVTETWTATDNCGRALASVSRTITVLPSDLPTMTALPNIQVACGSIPAASTLSFSNNLAGNCLISGTSNLSTFVLNANGLTGTETWTATDGCGRQLVSVSRTITFGPLPTASISGNNGPVCSGTNAVFSLLGTTNAVVSYSLNGGLANTITLTGGTATVTVTNITANQTLTLISVVYANCSQSLTATSTITVMQCNTDCDPVVHVINNYDVDINTVNYYGSLRWALDRVCENGIIYFDIDCPGLTINLNPTLGSLIIKKNVLFEFTHCQTCTTTGITINGSGINLTINTGKVLTLSGCTKFTFKGCIQNNNGVNGLVLNSGASLIYDCCNLPATAKRDLTNVWHLFGSPFVKNSGATLGSLTPPSGYTQMMPYTNGTGWGTTTTAPLFQFTPTVGYAVKPSLSLTAVLSGYLFCNSMAPNCDYYVNLVYSGTSALQSWNLVANPFPAYLNWNLLGKTSLNTTLYLWDNNLCPGCTPVTNGSYMRTYNSANNVGVPANTTPYISPMQGFFVKANYTNPKIIFPLSARTHTTSAYYKNASTEIIVRLKTETEGAMDELVICKNDNSALGLENFDSEKLFTDLPLTMYSEASTGERLVINTINTTNNTVIPLGLKGEAGMKAKITAFALESGEQVYLEDRLKGKLVSLTENTSYEFEFPTSTIQGRFFIRFGMNTNPIINSNINVFENEKELNVIAQTGENIQTVELYSITGACIFKMTGNGNTFNKKLDLADGVYMVRVKTSLATQNVKVNWR